MRGSSSRRSRPNRRASASAALYIRSDGSKPELEGLLAPPASMSSRRYSTTQVPLEPLINGASSYNESDSDYGSNGYRVKQESRSPSPDFLTARRRSISPVKREEKENVLIYASLPSSPISLTPVPSASKPPPDSYGSEYSHSSPQHEPFSLWDYLREELLATDLDSHQELKWERVSNFLSIPLAMEKASFQLASMISSPDFFLLDSWFWVYPVFRLISS